MIALLRFYVASGARVALVAGVPLAGIAAVGIGLQESPAKSIEFAASLIAGSPPSYSALAGLSALAFGLALWAVPRVTLGSDGWIRHLPASRAQHAIALIVAIACTEAPLVAATLGCAVLESFRRGVIAWPGFLLPPIIALATASLAIGVRPARRHGIRLGWLPTKAPFEVRVALRALGARVTSGWLVGAIPLGAAFLFVRNNVLPPHLETLGATLGGTLGATLALAEFADALAIRRPSWPWARALPLAARRRVAGDAVILAVLCAPILVATAALDPRAAAPVSAVMPLLALRAAAAMRRGGASRSAALGPVLIEGAFASGLLALLPWLGFAALAAIPFTLRAAAHREQGLKVTRWSALHHVAAGDTHSWTE